MSGELAYRSLPARDFVPYEDIDASVGDLADSLQMMTSRAPSSANYLNDFLVNPGIQEPIFAKTTSPDRQLYIEKMTQFENIHREDRFLEREQYPVLISSFKRLDRVQNLVGHGNFNVVSFDEMLSYGKQYSSIGRFAKDEAEFIEGLFTANAREYGFLGEKVITQLTARISERDRKKVPRTGHFLYRGDSEALYQKLRTDLGDNIVLTSGIRSIVKQTHLFLAKTIQSKGNLSRASRSLAPPGHSYHGIGDFDVGKIGFGRKNFTEAFATTDEYRKLVDLGYVAIRYPEGNLFGVRYEPWHIKVV